MIFKDGTREPLHGHNYRVSVNGHHNTLDGDMVLDFLDLKPIVRSVCDELDHKLLIQGENPQLEMSKSENQWEFKTPDGSRFSIPASDVLVLPIKNTSVERIAGHLAKVIDLELQKKFNFSFNILEVEVEESKGQSVIFRLIKEDQKEDQKEDI